MRTAVHMAGSGVGGTATMLAVPAALDP
jgi:hypothetical protein